MKIGLFFGSFNPIHIGHMAIANYIVEYTDIDKIWFIVSPQNPLKKKNSLLEEYHRYELVSRVIDDDNRFKAVDIEFRLPKPSYTIDTLIYLKEKYPDYEFVLIMGADGLPTFDKWKNYNQLIKICKRYIYPRPGISMLGMKNMENTEVVNAPQMEISSTVIRNAIKEGRNMRFFIPEKAFAYLTEMHFYEK